MSTKKDLVVVTDLTPEKIAYFDGLEAKQLEVVKENPLIEVVDKENYEEAKKRRTNLKTASTAIEKEGDNTKKFLNTFKSNVDEEFKKHANITREACNKQQSAIDVYEDAVKAEKERKRIEKEEAEQRIKDGINDLISDYKNQISVLNYANRNEVKENIEKSIKEHTGTFDQFDILFDTHVENVKNELSAKINQVEDEYVRSETDRKEKIKQSIAYKVHEIDGLTFRLTTDNMEQSENEINKPDSYDYMEFSDEMKTKVKDAKDRFFAHLKSIKVQAEEERNRKRIQTHKDNLENYRKDFLEGTEQVSIENYTQATVWIAKVNHAFDNYNWEEFADDYAELKDQLKKELEKRISDLVDAHNKEQEVLELKKDKLKSDRVAEIHQMENLDRDSESFKWAKQYGFEMLKDYDEKTYQEFISKIILPEIEEKPSGEELARQSVIEDAIQSEETYTTEEDTFENGMENEVQEVDYEENVPVLRDEYSDTVTNIEELYKLLNNLPYMDLKTPVSVIGFPVGIRLRYRMDDTNNVRYIEVGPTADDMA